jgi:hypothetical protein
VSEQAQDATDWLLEGWDEEAQGTSAATDVPQPTLSEAEPEEAEEEVEGTDEEEGEDEGEDEAAEAETPDEEEEAGEDEGEEEGDESVVEALAVAGFDTSDPDIRAFLAQYQNDPVKALTAAAHLRRAFDRQGTDLGQARQRAAELESQIARARMLGGGAPLSEEQHSWAEGAAASAAPGAYVQQALDAGEFDLARAVCSYWARESPYEAARAGLVVDQAESQLVQRAQAPVEAPTEDIVEALKSNVPGFREWEPQMVAVFNNLGPGHHLVQEARSNNIDVSMRALMSIFEIAQASTASVQEQRSEIRKRARAASSSAKAKAAVTSSSNSTGSPKETPRSEVQILPGLTLEDLETEFASQS